MIMQNRQEQNDVSDEKVRRIGIAVASWLCGALEGSVRDNADLALAEALDLWLRHQKNERRVLFTGKLLCAACGRTWEELIASDNAEPIQCPHCGHRQHVDPVPVAPGARPENNVELDRLKQHGDEVLAILAELNDNLKTLHGREE
jgi:DNA-directed RNA polymerase subunit RPC12/RpoP